MINIANIVILKPLPTKVLAGVSLETISRVHLVQERQTHRLNWNIYISLE